METQKPKKVLIALDYNPTAQKVAEKGYALAKSMGAKTILLHVISDPIFYTTPEYSPIMGFDYNNMEQIQLENTESLSKASQYFLDKAKEHLGDEHIDTIVSEGDYAEAILKTAKKLHVDIIVMGSHSQKWLENILMGSVTEKVLHQTTIPLYIIPTKKQK